MRAVTWSVTLRWIGAALLALVGLVACGEDTTTVVPPPPGACASGGLDCACGDGGVCGAGLSCQAGVCRAPACALGDEGCACFDDDTCRLGEDGRPMACVAGVCQVQACVVGAQGCPCDAAGGCGEGLFCSDGVCADPGCEPGALDCVCNAGACAIGLLCDGGRCVDPGCTLGAEGCACLDGGCQGDLSCRDGRCVAPCPAGEAGCACDDGACSAGLLCVADTCVTCTPGTVGCVCGAGDACAEGATCQAGQCVPEACEPGTAGCACDAGACGAGLACGDDGLCAACPAGEVGCACDAGACADPAAARCVDGTCEAWACELGTEGCGCGLDGGCGLSDRGEPLACQGGRCEAPSCAPGEAGCVCAWGTGCAAGSACVAGFCQPQGCARGSEGCGCAAGGACDGALTCRAGAVCVDGAGFDGGACLEGDACHPGAVCDDGRCRACRAGSRGCACVDGGCALGLLCEADRCVAPDRPIEALVPPADPQCYSHCEASIEDADGRFRRCPASGIMAGCLDDRVCVQGSCIEEGGEVPTCRADWECPRWQLCIQGGCYSNCERTADCSAGYTCHDKVCRLPCDPTQADNGCGVGEYCDSSDGTTGVCQALVPVALFEGEPAPDGVIQVDKPHVAFTNADPEEQILITNTSDLPQRVVVRKRAHTLYGEAGPGEQVLDLDDDQACVPGADCPLFWLTMGELGGEVGAVQTLSLVVPAQGSARVQLSAAGAVDAPRWQGEIEVVHPTMNTRRVALEYSEVPEGQWVGNVFYFGLFGDEGLDAWTALPNPEPGSGFDAWAGTKDDSDAVDQIGNALLQRWSAFRRRRIPYAEFEAALASVMTESWRWERVQADCPDDVCYPYVGNRLGLRPFSSDRDTVPVPSGIVELPFGMNLRVADGDAAVMTGRIDSDTALHYAGEPAVSLTFDVDPSGCSRDAQGVCLAFVQDLDATIAVGGRYATDPARGCDAATGGAFERFDSPWLVPGFLADTWIDEVTGQRMRSECRDGGMPFQRGLDPAAERLANLALTGANPVPDGRPRRRGLELIDGALINQSTLLIFFRERFESFLDPEGDAAGFSSYGVMVLRREATRVDDVDADGDGVADAYQGSTPDTTRDDDVSLLAVACSDDLVAETLGVGARLTDATAEALAVGLLDGVVPGRAVEVLDADSEEQPHYLCVQTGLFDGGPQNATPHGVLARRNDDSCGRVNGLCEDGGDSAVFDAVDGLARCRLGTDRTDCGPRYTDATDSKVPCPVGSEVIYFTVDRGALSQAGVADAPCQQDGTCGETLAEWRRNALVLQPTAAWRCADPDAAYCSDDRGNLRHGKQFFSQAADAAVFEPLHAAIDRAFRYKTRFQSRQGEGIGFAPEICAAASYTTPYCYNPAAIEQLRARVDCLLDLHQAYADALDADTLRRLGLYLAENFAYAEERRPGNRPPVLHDGFERLYAELLTMQGDEALTRAFASRFDLAGLNAAAFPGAQLEANGFDLAGQAGYELRSLYQAAQTYQLALDRFYALSPSIWGAIEAGQGGFITPATVTWYFDRLVRASTQKTRAWAEIAQRYQRFNRPDLARMVARRAYTAGYLESVVMGRMMLQVVDVVAVEDRAQIRAIMEAAQGRSRVALSALRTVFGQLSEAQTVFGLAPDYVPMPALDGADFRQSNAFEAVLRRAQQKAETAREREEVAIASTREFDTDTEQFQAELARIQATYEDQLADLCGVFEGDDGVVYPAIARYGDRSELTTAMGDPCGLMQNGQIHTATVGVEGQLVALRAVAAQINTALESVEIERRRVSAQCGLVFELGDFQYEQSGRTKRLDEEIRLIRFGLSRADRILGHANTVLQFTSAAATCTPLPFCSAQKAAAGAIYLAASTVVEVGAAVGELIIEDKQRDLVQIGRETARWQTEAQCDTLIVDGNARMAELLLQLKELEIEQLRAEVNIQQALANVDEARVRARRVQQQQRQAEQLQINAAAARTDPNVRLYRNDAIINADLAFEDAMREAWRLTRIYEYYTAQTYAEQDRLFFIRLVARGDDNLENYLTDLSNAFNAFEEEAGLPDSRVLLVSLKDDILKVPFVDDAGNPLSPGERTARMREALRDPKFLDERGYITLPFNTDLADVSPLTRNHKLFALEAEIIASDFGDHVGRLYVSQRGTGVVRNADDGIDFYRLPARTAVLNPFFNGSRFFDPTIYRNFRLRDRPLVNTAWELVLNLRTEQANADLDLQSLTDVRLFVYYTDFTRPF